MKIIVFDNIDLLNEYIEHRKADDIEIQFNSQVVGSEIGDRGVPTYKIIDRFLVIIKK